MAYLDTRSATAQDRRAALLAAIQAAAMSDDGAAIAGSIVTTLRERGSLLPAIDTIERIGLAGRDIARRRAERTLIEDYRSIHSSHWTGCWKLVCRSAKRAFIGCARRQKRRVRRTWLV